MSVFVMSWVFQHSNSVGSARLVLLALADFAHDDGTRAFPSVETLAAKTRMSKRSVQYALRKLAEDGDIEDTQKTTGSGTRVYSVLMGGANLAPVQPDDRGVQPVAPNPLEPSALSEGNTQAPRASANGKVVKFNGKPVVPEVWQTACGALAVFNELTDNAFPAVSSGGDATEVAKRIYGRASKWPSLTVEQHRDIIERTLMSKWWGDDPPSIGVVYGPKVFEENMVRKPTARQSKQAARNVRADRGLAAIERIIQMRQREREE